jgi:hypothetical protein
LFAGLALCVVSSAQQAVQPDQLAGPLGKVHYDLATGKVTKVVYPREVRQQQATNPSQAQRAAVLTFNNSLTTGWFWSGALGTSELDWAYKGAIAGTGLGLQLVDSFVMAYATYAFDPSNNPSGGPAPGAETIVSMFSGTQGRCTGLGNIQAAFLFTGLPGVTGCMGPGSGAGYSVTAWVADPRFCLPDGNIGYSYSFIQDRGVSTLQPPSGASSTGALLMNFGTNFPFGWEDAFDWWIGSPGSFGSCIGTYWFGGCNTADPNVGNLTSPCGSFYMVLREEDSAQAAVATHNFGGNPLLLSASNLPRVGQTLTINHTLVGGYAISLFPRFPTGVPLSGPLLFGFLHLNIGSPLYKIKAGVQPIKNIPIPCDSTLLGAMPHIQGFHVTGTGPLTLQLQNTLDLTLGG